MRTLGALGNPVQFLGVNEKYNEKPAALTYDKKVNEKGEGGDSKMRNEWHDRYSRTKGEKTEEE